MTNEMRVRLLAGGMVTLWGCGDPEPVEFPAGETVSVGSAAFSVQQVWTEELSDGIELSVHVRVDLPTRTVSGSNAETLESILLGSLVDSAGRRYRPMGLPLPEQIDAYRRRGVDYSGSYDRAMNDARKVNRAMTTGELPEEWTTWVVMYTVPRDARSLRLVVRNPAPREGQARAVAIPIRA